MNSMQMLVLWPFKMLVKVGVHQPVALRSANQSSRWHSLWLPDSSLSCQLTTCSMFCTADMSLHTLANWHVLGAVA